MRWVFTSHQQRLRWPKIRYGDSRGFFPNELRRQATECGRAARGGDGFAQRVPCGEKGHYSHKSKTQPKRTRLHTIADAPYALQIGTSSLMHEKTGLPAISKIAGLVEIVCSLKRSGKNVILVTSGAVGFGCLELKLKVSHSR